MQVQRQTKGFAGDLSLWLLLFFNLATIYFAVAEGWSLMEIILVYWFQSVAIGFFNVIRILQLKEFTTEGFKINGVQPKPTTATKITTAVFFLVHYGTFHFVYLIFIISGALTASEISIFLNLQWGSVALACAVFFINHAVSYYYNKSGDAKILNIGSLMFYPYARILPMHFTIILGAVFGNVLIGFLILKTIADVIMHKVEHAIFRS